MNDKASSHLDELLDLIADEVARRIAARSQAKRPDPEPPTVPSAPVATPPSAASPAPAIEPAIERTTQATPVRAPEPEPVTSSHAASLMARLALGVLVVIVLINIPLNAQGTALARSIPNSASLVIANGLVVKEANSPDVYVYRDNAFHWITSLDAFEYFGYRWQNVQSVEAGFLNQYPKGTPIYVLLKCNSSPNIYQLDAGKKRWIVDIPTFTAQGFVWGDVKIVTCDYLRRLPDGDSVPPGRGSPPGPLP